MRKKREIREAEEYVRIRKKFRTLSMQSLFVAGLMLYVAEGDKKDRYHIGLANTDPEIIKFFIWWMEEYLSVPKERVRAQLHLYASMDIAAEKCIGEGRQVCQPPVLQSSNSSLAREVSRTKNPFDTALANYMYKAQKRKLS